MTDDVTDVFQIDPRHPYFIIPARKKTFYSEERRELNPGYVIPWNYLTSTVPSVGIVYTNPVGFSGTYNFSTQPRGICYDSYTKSIWTINPVQYTISKIRASDGVLLGNYAGGGLMKDICFDPSTNSVWFTDQGGTGRLVKINVVTGAVTKEVLMAGNNNVPITFNRVIYALASDGIPSIWVGGGVTNDIRRFRASDGVYLSSTPLGSITGYGVCFDPVNNIMWGTAEGSDKIDKVNANTSAWSTEYVVGSSPHQMVYDPSTLSIWTVIDGAITKTRASTGQLLNTFTYGSSSDITFDSYTSTIWQTSNVPTKIIRQLSPANGAILTSYTLTVSPNAICYDSDTNDLWVCCDNDVRRIRSTNLNPTITQGMLDGALDYTITSVDSNISINTALGYAIINLPATPATNDNYLLVNTGTNVTLVSGNGKLIGTLSVYELVAGATKRFTYNGTIWVVT